MKLVSYIVSATSSPNSSKSVPRHPRGSKNHPKFPECFLATRFPIPRRPPKCGGEITMNCLNRSVSSGLDNSYS